MVDSAEETQFHWLAGDGKQRSGGERALCAALTSGTLSATSLVWRAGWAEWLPANRIAELASAISEGSRETPLKPRRHPAVLSPPRAPAEPLSAVPPQPSVIPPQRTPPQAKRSEPPPPPIRGKVSTAPAGGKPVNGRHAQPPGPVLRGPPPHDPRLPTKPKQEGKVAAADAHGGARDTLNPSSFGVIGTRRAAQPAATTARGEGAPGVPLRRMPLPTLTEEGGVPAATATLRPPGAVPPPTRGVPAVPALDSSPSFSFEKRTPVATPVPAFAPPGSAAEAPPRTEPVTPAINEPARAAPTLPPVVNRELLREPYASLDSTLEVATQVPPEALRTPLEPLLAARAALNSASEDVLARALRRHSRVMLGRLVVDSRMVVMALSALCGALLVAVFGLFVTRGRAPASELARSARASTPPAPTPLPGCRVSVPAALIAPNIERAVPPYATKLGNDPGLALGFAVSMTKGVGLRLNPGTLDTVESFEEDGKDAIRGVVPLTRSGTLAFFADRDDSALRSAHTVDEIPPFTLGVSDAGFSRVMAGRTSLVWPLEANLKITEPRAARVGGFGYGVTFRRGGQSGAVLLGFVASDGSKKSELVEIPDAPKFLGTPVIAGSAAGVLVAFAGRAAPEAAWKVFVSLTPPGAPARAARELITAAGGGAISPAVSALGPDRWLVQWTEGVSGQFQVRVQSFAADLSALGAKVLVSPKGANAGQGSLCALDGGATSLFILTTAGHDELWGTTLSCQ